MRAVKIAGRSLQRSAHVCVFYNSDEEKYRTLLPYIKDGIEAGDKTVHLLDPSQIQAHICCMKNAGIDADAAMARDQLEVLPWDETYLLGGRFEATRMVNTVAGLMESVEAKGYPFTRLIGGMEWALLDKPGVGELVEYESRVNKLFQRYDMVAICAYDLRRHKANVVMDVLRTHPFVIVGGILQDNPFYVPPDEFVEELREREPAPALA
jgi:MEDS: MEthanogen/methylotroph, DcmR Sensory domain